MTKFDHPICMRYRQKIYKLISSHLGHVILQKLWNCTHPIIHELFWNRTNRTSMIETNIQIPIMFRSNMNLIRYSHNVMRNLWIYKFFRLPEKYYYRFPRTKFCRIDGFWIRCKVHYLNIEFDYLQINGIRSLSYRMIQKIDVIKKVNVNVGISIYKIE